MTAILFPGDPPDDAGDGGLIGDRYRFLSPLGQGGMGFTERRWDIHAGRPVVVKRPRPEFVAKPGFLERFDREVRLMRSFQHPHIVPIIDAGAHAGLPFIVMPFLPGGSLSVRRLRDADGRPQPNTASMLHLWLPGIAAALDHLHARGVIHRDVKPANIFFDAFWTPYLGDFGIAKVVDEIGGIDREQTLTGTNVAVGTELYMGPELFTAKPALTGAVDQYALAVIVYEMMCGRRPFTSDPPYLYVEVATKPVPPLDRQHAGLPPRLVQAVHRGLSKRPSERFPSCAAFAAAVLADVPPMADDPGVARFACPACGHLIKIATGDAGRRGRCPKCSKRLVIAADLAALWTRDEEPVVAGQPHTPWPVGDEATPPPTTTSPTEESGPVFEPLSLPTPLPRRKRESAWPRRFMMIALVMLNVGGAAFIGTVLLGDLVRGWLYPPRQTPFVLDHDAPVTLKKQQLQVFPPVGWRNTPRASGCLAAFEPKNGKPVPLICLVAGNDPAPRPNIAFSGRLMTAVCGGAVNGRPYSVAVIAPEGQAKDAQNLAGLVAGGLRPWVPPPIPPKGKTGLRVEYFRDRELRDRIDFTNVTPDVSADWGDGPPVAGLPPDNFSVRWTGYIRPPRSGQIRFSGNRDNGLRLTVNGQRIVEQWNDGWGPYQSDPIQLLGGRWYPIQIELYDSGGAAALTLEWQGDIGEPELVPGDCLRPDRP